MRRRIMRCILMIFAILVSFAATSVTYASGWQISDDPNGQGSNAIVNVRLPIAKPSWASLIVDFGTVRNCSAGLGFLFYKNRDLGRHKKSKRNPDASMVVSIDGKRWDQKADGMRVYENGFEVAVAIYSQELLDALAYGSEATVSILVSGEQKIGVIFDIRGGINAINPAHDRCRAMIQ
jgi:hypothetical protein